MTSLEAQLEQLRQRRRDTVSARLPSGTTLVTMSDIPLPPGWNLSSATVRFLVPPAYPMVALDCFWTQADLRLADGSMPMSTAMNPVPETPEQSLWFSWHLTGSWNPNRDTLVSWFHAIQARLGDAR